MRFGVGGAIGNSLRAEICGFLWGWIAVRDDLGPCRSIMILIIKHLNWAEYSHAVVGIASIDITFKHRANEKCMHDDWQQLVEELQSVIVN